MTNEVMYKNLIDRYNAKAYTHNYIYGFTYKGTVYMAYADAGVMPFVCKLDKASRGCGYALRFCPTTAQKLLLLPNAKPLCSALYFDEVCKSNEYNRGENFEKLVTELYGQTWVKDSVPFTEAGDLEADGVAYQIKYEKATFCNEKSIANLER